MELSTDEYQILGILYIWLNWLAAPGQVYKFTLETSIYKTLRALVNFV